MSDNLKKTIKGSFRMEMIGTGLYRGLAKQYQKKDHDLSRRFSKFSNQEAMHGRLFKNYANDKFGQRFISGFFWQAMGRLAAFFMRPMPLNKKLKKIHAAEEDAVTRIEKVLTEDLDSEYRKIMKTILPHEIAHAALYSEVYTEKSPMNRVIAAS